MSKRKNGPVYYATLKADFTFTHPIGEVITWKAGKRFRITHNHTYGDDGALYIDNYFAYGCGLEIPAEYLHPRTSPPSLIERYLNKYPTRMR